MGLSWKIAIALTAYQLVSSGCHHAEIDLSDLLAEAGQKGSSEATAGADGAGDEPGQSSEAGGHTSEAGGHAGETDNDSGEAASSNGGASSDSGEVVGSAGSRPMDTTPPRVLWTSPSDGERGVRSDSKIVIRFSEPMDPVRTEAAVDLEGLPISGAWDEQLMELSVIPEQGLEYAQGIDPPYVEALAYSLSVNGLATDLAGNALGQEYTSTFYTSRQLSTTLPGINALIGYAIDSDEPRDSAVFADPSVGDASDESMKAFITTDLGALPPETQAVTSATLTVSQYQVTGEPYQMGSMLLEHVSFSALEYVLTAPTKTSFGALFADAETKTATMNVTSAVQTQLAERADSPGQVQFRFAFEQAVNPNGQTDEVRLGPLTLEVWYLVP
jgi:hypothetical protein